MLKFWIFNKIKKARQSLALFSRKSMALAKHSELHIHYKSLELPKVYDHAGSKEYSKDFTVALTIFDVFYETQMCDSVTTGKENASKDCNCIMAMFLTSFVIHFAFGMHAGAEQGGTLSRLSIHCGGRRKVPTIQHICFRKISGSDMGAPNFLPQEPSNLVTPLYACFMCMCLKRAIWLFGDKIWLFWRRQVGNPAKQQTQQD